MSVDYFTKKIRVHRNILIDFVSYEIQARVDNRKSSSTSGHLPGRVTRLDLVTEPISLRNSGGCDQKSRWTQQAERNAVSKLPAAKAIPTVA